MDTSLCLKGEIVLEDGKGEQIARLRLDGVADDLFDENALEDAELQAEQYVDLKFIRPIRSMVRAHIQKLRMEKLRGRLDRPFSPYGDWNPPDPDMWASSERMAAELHDSFIEK